MTPKLQSQLRKMIWPLILVVCAVAYLVVGGTAWNSIHSRTIGEDRVVPEVEKPRIPDEWLYVTENSVLFFPVVSGECSPKNALGQVHKGTKVLVIFRHDEWVEVERDDQTALHTHGCIHESMLEKRDD